MEPTKTVLVAEDDGAILEVITEVLEDEGFRVIQSTGEDADAVDKIEQYRPVVAILDYQLPGMTGVEIAHRVRQQELQDIRIVAMTAAHRAERVCAEMQADACLAKPFNVEDLLAAVDRSYHQGHLHSL